MLRIAARRVVARVPDDLPVWDVPVLQRPGEPVGRGSNIARSELPVPALGCCRLPFPAFIRAALDYLASKPFLY